MAIMIGISNGGRESQSHKARNASAKNVWTYDSVSFSMGT